MITDYELIEELKKIKTEAAAKEYMKKYIGSQGKEQFHEYFRQRVMANNLTIAEVMNNSHINKNYGYNIVNGTRKRPGREKVIALCVGAAMSFDETQKALMLSGQSLLDPRCERDVWIAVALNNGMRDVLMLNIKLEEKGLEPLEV